jgi:hypothetical protein
MAVDIREIKAQLLRNFNIDGEFSISSDTGLVSVSGSAKLIKECEKLPVSFDRVGGSFFAIIKNLRTLEGSPQWVGGDFNCSNNQLTTNLKGAPIWVGGSFSCGDNTNLKSLEHGPVWVGKHYNCWSTAIETLEGAAEYVGGDFYVIGTNNLISLRGIPSVIEREFYCYWTKNLKICSLAFCDMMNMDFKNTPGPLERILNKYRGSYKPIPFATALIKAGYGANAWL